MSTMAEQSLLHRPSGGQVFGTLAASPAARLCWIGALISVAMIYIASFGKMPVHPGFGDGPSIYIASAQSLAQGTGYRLMYYPQVPPGAALPNWISAPAVADFSRVPVWRDQHLPGSID